MLKKILFTLLVIFLVYWVVRWRQRKTAEIASQPQGQKTNTTVYYLAGAVISLMVVSIVLWLYYTLN